MNRFIRYWNQNRTKIITATLIVALLIILVHIINYMLGQRRQGSERVNNTTAIEDTSIPTESVISGQVVDEATTTENIDIIKQFVEFCNNGDYQNAYNLLSDDCREELYNTAEDFKTNYMDRIFNSKKTYELELWFSDSGNYTYRMVYYDDNILSTGQINVSNNNREDYVTVSRQDNGDRKLNISGFIDKETINNSHEEYNINLTINDRKRYREYEIYTLTIENRTDKTIILSEGTNGNDICLVDINGTEYNSFINEIPLTSLQVTPYGSKIVTIRFNKMYDEYREVESVLFKNIILDKDSYDKDSENVAKATIGVAL